MEKGYHTSYDSLDPLFLPGFMNLEKSFFQGEQEFQSPVFSIFCRNVSFMEKNGVLHDGESPRPEPPFCLLRPSHTR